MSVRTARRLVVEGVVQGVGFRPFVHRLAAQHRLGGWVRNAGSGVEALVEGDDAQVEAFLRALAGEPPPLARITALYVDVHPAAERHAFAILASELGAGTQPLPADVALCADCRRELYAPDDRRFHYPFINCTNCGPRYSIVEALPYDRERTTMRAFDMCAACRAEYEDPRSRRFHAEPTACPACGPRLRIVEHGVATADHPLARARRLLAGGKVVALKGVGGYHLACDARDAAAVARLRAWKRRGDRPLAVMVRDAAGLDRIATVSAAERALLESAAHPVVLLEQRSDTGLAAGVNPGVSTIGVMLPYTPLHELLLSATASSIAVPPVLVMTSANRSSDPTITADDVALRDLREIADAVVLHDREIAVRVDDSVVQVVDGNPVPLRRARGYAPLPLRLPMSAPPLLACGADLKNAFCVAAGERAVLSSHIGDLEEPGVFAQYETAVDRLLALMRIDPVVIAHDLHPSYWSRAFAERAFPGRQHVAVQHHHAHVAACMAEHGLTAPVIGVAFDGTGYGTDGNVWGGEFLVADYAGFERAAHLDEVPMYGGEAAIREPWRMALAYLRAAGIPWDDRLAPVRALGAPRRAAFESQVAAGVAAPLTSSAGRLFDAVAALLGLRQTAGYEAQAAIELEAVAAPGDAGAYDFALHAGAPLRVNVAPAMCAIVADLDAGTPVPAIAARFHATVVAIVARVCTAIRAESGWNDVVLSGGVFQNRRLASGAAAALARGGFAVHRHHLVPPNDGGLAYGQAAIAAMAYKGAG